MSMPAFDTLKFAKRLREVGVPEPQAEVQVEMLAEAMAERMATKEDLAKTEIELKRDIKELDAKIESTKADLQRDIKELDAKMETKFREMDAKTETKFREMDARLKELELRMVIKMGAMILAGIGILFGLMRTWPLPVQYVPSPGQEMRYLPPQAPIPAPPR
ncbi:MAG: hypothetical protein G8345_13695 [Magnetococcales bacterium]|nr:hypothetical protein [Magnetococcales bacterium]NGZ27928.1 hypothetical protein [Magnetococcales bacterium]